MAEKQGKIRITASAELGELQRLNGAIEKMEAGFLKSVSAASLLNKGWGVLASTIKEGYADLDLYSKATVVFTGNLEMMRKATKGTVADLDLMQAANRMTTLGVKLTDQEMATLLGDVKKLAGAMGIDMKSALESTATALARQSDKIADNVGIVLKAESAQEKYAASLGRTVASLTDAEKKLAFQKEFVEQAHAKAMQLAESNATLTESFKKLAVSIKNATMEMLNWINKLPAGTPGLKMTRHGLEMPTWSIDQEWLARQGEAPIKRLTREGLAEARASEERNLIFKEGDSVFNEYERMPGYHGGTQKAAGGGRRKKDASGFDADLERQARELEEEREYIIDRATKRARRELAAARRQREGDVEAEGEQQKAQAGLEFKAFGAQAGRNKKGGKLAGTFAGKLFGDEVLQGAVKTTEALARYEQQVKDLNSTMQDFTLGSLANMAGGIWAIADAAIQSGEGFGTAMLQMVKSTLLGIAQQATVKAIFSTAEGFALQAATMGIPNPGSIAAFTAAGLYASIAAGTGIAGLVLSFATAGSGASAGAGRGASSGANYRPSFGAKQSSKDLPPIVIRLTFDRNDPASESMARRKVKADMLAAGYEDAA